MWLYFFEIYPEFEHRPLSERRKAAYHAQQSAFRHWQTWAALLFLVVATAGLAWLVTTFSRGTNGTSGAVVGFSLGMAAFQWAIYRFGLPYYRRAMNLPTHIPSLGPLHPDPSNAEWLVSRPVPVPYFDGCPLTFALEGLVEADIQDVENAVGAFLALDAAARLTASSHVFRNYERKADAIGENQIERPISGPEEVWSHVNPSRLIVSRRHHHDRLIYVRILAECDWEREHGFQMVYRRGNELCRVSGQDGHVTHADAQDIPEDQDWIA